MPSYEDEMDSYSPAEDYQDSLLKKLREAYALGEEILGNEEGIREIQKGIDYIEGKQITLQANSLSRVQDNRIKKVTQESVASLTDVRPIWNFESNNDEKKPTAEVLNKLSRGWWRAARADRKLEDALMYAFPGGSGYLALTYDPEVKDLILIPFDPRDVIPIEPVFSDSVQDWQGVMLRQRVSKEWLKTKYPSKAEKIENCDTPSWTERARGTPKGGVMEVVSAFWQSVRGTKRTRIEKADYAVDLLRIYIKDYSLWKGEGPVRMGKPGDPGSYIVYPVGYEMEGGKIAGEKDARLYPRGRMIIAIPSEILDDQANPYLHGKFPVVRVTLDPTPWSLLGMPIVNDLLPLQDMLNKVLRAMEDGVEQWARRGVVTDKNSMDKGNLQKIDTRRAGIRVQVNPTMGEGFKLLDGPTFPNWITQLLQFLREEIDSNSGVSGLQQLAQMKTMLPDTDKIEQFDEALNPLLKRRARGIELALSELAELLKFGFFQYYTTERRVAILGPSGAVEEDFNFSPGDLMPDESEMPGMDLEARTLEYAKQFSFTIAPNSFLNVSHAAQRMMMLQLFRANGLDIWTMWESMDIPNIGKIPAETVPERMVKAREMGLQPGPTPDLVQATNQAQLAQATMGAVQAQMALKQLQAQAAAPQIGPEGPPGPGGPGGPPPEGGGGPAPGGGGPGGPPPGAAPSTSGVGPQGGRPPSGGAPPRMEIKQGPEGPRTTVTESRK